MVNATRPPSIFRSLMKPRLTMSRCRSGSVTTFSASSTAVASSGITQEYNKCVSGAPPPNRGLMIALAYLWPLAIVPLLLEKDDPEVQWHAKHGLVLMVAELVVLLAFVMVTS